MKKVILLLIISFFFIRAGQSFAGMMNYYYAPNGIESVTGIIEARGFNSIDIYDEQQKRSERFIYLEKNEQFQKGDYVRIYYRPKGGIVVSVKKMTVFEYKENGQNLGNILYKASN